MPTDIFFTMIQALTDGGQLLDSFGVSFERDANDIVNCITIDIPERDLAVVAEARGFYTQYSIDNYDGEKIECDSLQEVIDTLAN